MLENGMQVERFSLNITVTPGQPINEAAEPIGLMRNDAGVFSKRLIRQFSIEQLRGPAQSTERILNFMC